MSSPCSMITGLPGGQCRALRMEWPRIPLPGWPDGAAEGAAEALAASAARGRELARLLDPEAPVPGVTQGPLRPEIAPIAVPATTDGRNMTGDDFAVTAGWGHFGTGDAVMPGQGRIVERAYTPDEKSAMGDNIPTLGETTFDVYLNDRAFWRNVPAAVWTYKLGGYQVLKKWLSYRERADPRPPSQTRGSPALHRYGEKDCGNSAEDHSMNLTSWKRLPLLIHRVTSRDAFWWIAADIRRTGNWHLFILALLGRVTRQ